jgi:hypothetical protein
MKLIRMGWAGDVARIGAMRNAQPDYISAKELQGDSPLWRPKHVS